MPGPADLAEAQFRQGVAAAGRGELDEAAAAYRRALALHPAYPEALVNLATILRRQGHPDEAVAALRQALTLRPDYPLALFNLGNALRRQGGLDEAAELYRRAIALRPDYGDAYHNLGVALRDRGDLEGAAASFEQAIALSPPRPEAALTLGSVYLSLGRFEAAEAAFRQASALRPNDAAALHALGSALYEQGRPAEAEAAFREALDAQGGRAETHYGLGMALWSQGRVEEAILSYRHALALREDYPAAHNNLGAALGALGRLDEARTACRRAVALQPDFANAHYNLALLSPAEGEAAPASPDLAEDLPDHAASDARSYRLFARGKALEARGDFGRAFECYAEASAIHWSHAPVDIDAVEGDMRAVADLFDAPLLARLDGLGRSSEQPVFIVGMPRSGSSLIEQILASHPEVHGAGETLLFPRLIRDLRTAGATSSAGDDETFLRQAVPPLAERYLQELRRSAPGALRTTDKTLDNFLHLGLIHLCLPQARIIHCQRDPRDACLSAFATRFSEGWDVSYDLAALGRYWRAYDRLMDHWSRVLPAGRMLEVPYEAVVGDLETWARRLLSHCGLAWDPQVLRFNESARTVFTASFAQVRRPIYPDSVGRWRRFQPDLAPLLDALGPPWNEEPDSRSAG